MILSKVFGRIIFCTFSYQTAYADTGRKTEEGIGMWIKFLLSAAIIALGVYTAYQMIKYT